MQFREFPKMARLSRDVIVTEKIDGTNASVTIQNEELEDNISDSNIIAIYNGFTIRAGSRTRWIIPGNDNAGFAGWVLKNHKELIDGLGEGTHFGEWWGSGIQCGYNLPKGEKRFSLFNVHRWGDTGKDVRPACCHVVPVLYEGPFDFEQIEAALSKLESEGSIASPGFMNPEGIIVFHTAANIGFKKTIKNDETPKSLVK